MLKEMSTAQRPEIEDHLSDLEENGVHVAKEGAEVSGSESGDGTPMRTPTPTPGIWSITDLSGQGSIEKENVNLGSISEIISVISSETSEEDSSILDSGRGTPPLDFDEDLEQ